MSRYIDADALEECSAFWLVGVKGKALDTFIKFSEVPTIDIVRCRECRYCKKKRGTFKGEPIIFYRCTENNRDVESDDFCSYGERSSE